MDLRCRKTNCLYNKDLTCQAKNIKITNKFVCDTFKRDPKKQGTDFSNKVSLKKSFRLSLPLKSSVPLSADW